MSNNYSANHYKLANSVVSTAKDTASKMLSSPTGKTNALQRYQAGRVIRNATHTVRKLASPGEYSKALATGIKAAIPLASTVTPAITTGLVQANQTKRHIATQESLAQQSRYDAAKAIGVKMWEAAANGNITGTISYNADGQVD